MGQGEGRATAGCVGTLDSPESLPAVTAWEANLRLISGKMILCWLLWVSWERPGAFPHSLLRPGQLSVLDSFC